MKLLLTSAGINNTSIHNALVDLLGKPIAESSALCIPTGIYPFPGGPTYLPVHQRISPRPHVRIGLEVVGSAGADRAAQHQRRALDPCGPGGRRPAGLGRQSLVSVLLDAAVRTGRPLAVAAHETVYVGTSGGAMVATPDFGGETYDDSEPLTSSDRALGWLISRCFRTWSARTCRTLPWPTSNDGPPGFSVPAYAIDDQTAVKVIDGAVEVVSEGHWKLFSPSPEASQSDSGTRAGASCPIAGTPL